MRIALPVSVIVALSASAWAQAPLDYGVSTADSSLTYHLVHKLHHVAGVSKKVEGKARLLPDGKAQVMVRVPVESFDSGNVNRDAHMKEAVEASRYPAIELKALGDGIVMPSSFPATIDKTFHAQLTFHGIQQLLDIPVKLVFERADRVRAACSFPISLDAFKVERPSLMFVKVDDALKIDAVLVFAKP